MQVNKKKQEIDKEQDYDQKLKLILPALLAFANNRVFNSSDAGDIVQDTMIILSNKRQSYNENKSFYSWAFQICHFQILKYFKQKKRNREDLLYSESVSEDSFLFSLNYIDSKCPLGSVLAKEIKHEQKKILSSCDSFLNDKQKTILNYSLSGKSNKEIINALNITSGDFYANKRRIIKKIKKSLIRYE